MKKLRVKTNTKGKRWTKGHSCVSNPEATKYRDAAKSRFFQPNLVPTSSKPGTLTYDALRRHDVMQSGAKSGPSSTTESMSEGVQSSKTFASDWSNCSNKSFDSFLRGFQASNELHQEMLAVLAGITEVIKANGGSETANEYFGALMTSLDECDNENSCAAVLALIALVIKKVSPNIIKLKFNEIATSLFKNLEKFSGSENAIVLKALIVCLGSVLRMQDPSAWSAPLAGEIFKALLAYVTHSMPKVRKVAQAIVTSVLRASERNDSMHPAASVAGQYCQSVLDSNECLSEITRTLHVVNLLRTVINQLPAQQVKGIVEKLLTLMTLGDGVLTKCCLQTLQGLVTARPSTKTLPSDLNGKLINALFKFQPSSNDTDLVLMWLSVMHEALSNLLENKPQLSLEQIPRFFKVCTDLMCLGSDISLIGGTALALKVVVLECLGPRDAPLDAASTQAHKAALQSSLDYMERCLKFQHKATWKYVVHVLQAIYQVIPLEHASMLNRTLAILAGIRQNDDQVDLAAEIDKAIGALVKNLGPELVLCKVPLQISGYETSFDFPSSWLIPVLRDNIEVTTLAFFHNEIFPKAVACYKRWKELEGAGDKAAAHIFNVLFVQLWSIFPSCCTNPSDFKYFKKVAQLLGNTLNENEISLDVMTGLRKLITVALEDGDKKQLLGNFSKNYIPILCTIFTDLARPEGIRLASLETIKCFLKISDSEKHYLYFDKAVAKLDTELLAAMKESASGPAAQTKSKKQAKKSRLVANKVQDSILQLLSVLVPYQDETRLKQIANLCSHLVLSADHSEQKRAYRIIEQICTSEDGECKAYLQKNMDRLVQLISVADEVCKNPGRTARCRCLLLLSDHLQPHQGSILSQMITEGLLGCRNEKPKCRQVAFSLLVHLGKVRQRWTGENDSDSILNFVKKLLDCCKEVYAADSLMISASFLAIASLVRQLRETVPIEILPLVMPEMCAFASQSIREVSKAALSFFKCALTVFDPINLGPFISPMVTAICDMNEDCKRYLRLPTKEIFVRIARKFGVSILNELVPEDDLVMTKRIKIIKNMRKELERKARAKKANQQDSDEEDDLDTEFSLGRKPQTIESVLADECDSEEDYEKIMNENNEKKRPKKRQKLDTWIQESEDALDFTDPTSMQRISAKKPGYVSHVDASKKDKNRGFKVSSDGRLIINESDGEEEEGMNKFNRKRKRQDNDSDDLDDMDEAASQVGPRPGRYVMAPPHGDDLSRSMEDLSLQQQYKPGGSGIHRPVQGVHSGTEYKAAKAKGDVKKKGKVDPYAYIPLSGALLNKRKRAKNAGKIIQLEKAASKGVAKGLKAKAKTKRTTNFKKSRK
ncbi:RRP12-like protein [Neocloeon triangulifer]|uniref:RRP12-like protein n=1 Tax=Neocloeon triangulifer TaxID=2078957 RepID=UPI00286F23A4|nr:RRP12-like protein [Neocloeon triangulifer]